MLIDTSKQLNASFAAERPLLDHAHLTGKYRGAEHSEVNLAFKYQRFNNNKKNPSYIVTVVFHNLRGYDGHHLKSKFGKYKTRKSPASPATVSVTSHSAWVVCGLSIVYSL